MISAMLTVASAHVPQRFPVGADGYLYHYYDYDHVRRIATD